MRLEHRPYARAEAVNGALFGSVMVLGALLAATWLRLGLPRPVCHFRQWTGIACPTCGATRMVESLLAGDVAAALAWNPLLFLGLAGVALWAIWSSARWAFGLPTWRVVPSARERLGLRILAAVLLVAGWAYLVWRGV